MVRKYDDDQLDLFSRVKAVAARDEGMERVLRDEEDFKIQFGMFINSLPHGWEGICEDVRRVWPGGPPHHPNVWGACWNGVIKQGLLVRTDEMRRPTGIKSHRRPTFVYRRR
jgi:hypothetical protein